MIGNLTYVNSACLLFASSNILQDKQAWLCLWHRAEAYHACHSENSVAVTHDKAKRPGPCCDPPAILNSLTVMYISRDLRMFWRDTPARSNMTKACSGQQLQIMCNIWLSRATDGLKLWSTIQEKFQERQWWDALRTSISTQQSGFLLRISI